MTNCSAPQCKHSDKNCSLYRFPSDIARRMSWIKGCRRSFATTNHKLCKHHFRANCFRVKNGRTFLARNAVPSIFMNTEPAKRKVKACKNKRSNDKNEKHSTESKSSAVHLRIADCWSEQLKDQAKNELLSAIFETSNPLDDSSIELENRSTDNQALGLENIPITGSDIAGESNIEFSYSTPKKLNDLTPILAKWSPRINSVTSIIEDLIDSSDDDEDQCEEGNDRNHVIYIDEDSVKQEEFVDENSEEDFYCESNKSSRKDKEESNSGFDENEIKKEFHITDTLRVKLYKININGKSNNYQPNIKASSKTETSSKKKSNNSSSKKKLPKKSSCLKKLPKNCKTPQIGTRNTASHSTAKSKRNNAPEPKPQNTSQIVANNKRQSLRLSGKSPEIHVPEYVPSITRSGKKRVYEEPKSKSTHPSPVYTIDDEELPHRLSRTCVKKEPRNEETPRSLSPSPSAYKNNFEVIFVCQCCDKKYATAEHVKAHIMTHFLNCAIP